MSATPELHNQALLLDTLQKLLLLDATEIEPTLQQTADLLAVAFRADKVDVFLYRPETDLLVAAGTSDTPMGRKQRELGLHVVPVDDDGGRTAEVYTTGRPYLTGRADLDPVVMEGVREALSVRSFMIVPMTVAGSRRGVLAIATYEPERYSEQDLRFLEAAARWVGVIIQRTELVEQRQAETAARARQVVAEELLTFLAHDLKNYVMPIAMRLVALRQRAEREQRWDEAQALAEAKQGLSHLRALIDSLLDAGRLEQGVFALKFEETDLVQILEETVDALDPAGTDCVVDAPESLPAYADPVRVQTLLANLISNALKHAPDGTKVRVSIAQAGEWIHATVEDQGAGIDPAVLPRLFERFAAGPDIPGMGIGLYMAKQIAGAHGGSLSADSVAGTGTRFHLTLPAMTPQE